MNKQAITLKETGSDAMDARNMILKLIDCQINNYKMQFITKWEGDHSADAAAKDKKIAYLRKKKEEIIEKFRQIPFENVDLDISLDFQVKECEAELKVHEMAS
ncbi:hypothetical protein GYB22_08455 [bacterium]|nr:hypothetical protein [bacterium]